jgi:hypothetical protein
MNRLMILGGLVFTCVIVGCGPDVPSTVPVTGTVLLDGKPVEGATVNFLSKDTNIAASGKTDAEGKFAMKTFVGSTSVDGAVVGSHGVAVVKTEAKSAGDAPDDLEATKKMMEQMASNPAITSDFKPKALIPEKYSNPTMSQLTALVTDSGPNDFVLELTSGR